MGYFPDPLTVLKWTLSTMAVAIGGAGALLYTYQTSLIYPSNMPAGSRVNVPTPADFGMPIYEELTLIAPDGVRIKAYLILFDGDGEGDKGGVKAEDRPTVLLLHANAGNVGHRLPIARVFYKNMRTNILALSYRGYGRSEGSANEKGIRLDSQTALDYILSHPRLDQTKIILYGQSIGGAVAIDLASRNASRIHGVVVENTFLSLPKLVPHVMPFLRPVLFLLHQIWPSESLVPGFPKDLPVLYLSGGSDELVPPYMMKQLYDTSGGKAEFKSFERGTHNDTCIQPEYFSTIATFISSITSSASSFKSYPASDDGSYDLLADTEGEGEDEQEVRNAGGAGSRGDIGRIAKEAIKEKLDEKL